MYEQDDVHYFYWDWDLYKRFDYEPIVVHPNSGSKIVISRFHWIIGTIWTECIEEDDKPKVNFVRGVHTPIPETKNGDISYIEFEPNVSVEERFAIVNFYLPLFIRCWKSVKFSGAKKDYKHLMIQGGVPQKYVFNLSEIKFSFVIGHLPTAEDLPQVFREKLWPE